MYCFMVSCFWISTLLLTEHRIKRYVISHRSPRVLRLLNFDSVPKFKHVEKLYLFLLHIPYWLFRSMSKNSFFPLSRVLLRACIFCFSTLWRISFCSAVFDQIRDTCATRTTSTRRCARFWLTGWSRCTTCSSCATWRCSSPWTLSTESCRFARWPWTTCSWSVSLHYYSIQSSRSSSVTCRRWTNSCTCPIQFTIARRCSKWKRCALAVSSSFGSRRTAVGLRHCFSVWL